MKLPKEITVTNQEVRVDGELLPCPVAVSPPPEVRVSREELPTVTVTLMAERVLVDNEHPSSYRRREEEGEL